MNRFATALLAFCLVLPGTAALAADPALEEAMSRDGLQKINVKGIDLAYARPGVNLSAYTKVLVDPVQVSFSRNWRPTRSGSTLPLPRADRERIQTAVAAIVQEEFVRELRDRSSYQVVTSAGADVLRLKPEIINLYVSAPSPGSGRSRTYVISAGSMTLVAELLDSVSGQVQARLVDRRRARSSATMQLSTAQRNADAARAVAAAWARALRTAMDRAHGIGR